MTLLGPSRLILQGVGSRTDAMARNDDLPSERPIQSFSAMAKRLNDAVVQHCLPIYTIWLSNVTLLSWSGICRRWNISFRQLVTNRKRENLSDTGIRRLKRGREWVNEKKKEWRNGICAQRKASYLAIKVLTQRKRGNEWRTKKLYSVYRPHIAALFHGHFQFNIYASTKVNRELKMKPTNLNALACRSKCGLCDKSYRSLRGLSGMYSDSRRETHVISSFVFVAHLRVCHAEAIAFPCHKRPDESHSSFEEWRKCDFDSGNERFSCDQCHKSYGDVKNLLRHKRSKHPKKVDINAKIVKIRISQNQFLLNQG